MSVTLYGIKNCDTMKKAFAWLDEAGITYDFHDYKTRGADAAVLQRAFARHGWTQVINRRGTSWRKLSESVQSTMDETAALTAALDNPSLIKRPLMVSNDDIFLGFDPAAYKEIFKS